MKAHLYRNLFIVFFLLLAVLQFILLGKQQLQPWDEAIYAVRVQYLLETGNWLDQTDGAVGGFYSSAHPPLHIWLSALAVKVFGEGSFALRFWSLIFGLGTVLLVFIIPRNHEKGFYAAVLYGSTPFFLAYSKLGQLDTIYPFFLVAGLLFWLRYLDVKKKGLLLLTGLMFGLAMMSKIIVGLFLPISIGVYLMYEIILRKKKFKAAWVEFSILFLVGLVVFLPWHLFMWSKHGMDFLDGYLLFHIKERILEGVDQNTSSLGPVFYVNQLLVMLSASLAIVLWRLLTGFKKLRQEEVIYLIFGLVPFLVFTISTTKIRTYALPMLPFFSLLFAVAVVDFKSARSIKSWLIGLAVFLALWSVSQHFRDQLQALNFSDVTLIVYLTAGLILGLTVYFIKLRPGHLLILMLVFFVSRPFYTSPIVYHKHDMQKLSAYYDEMDFDKLIYLDRRRTSDDPLVTYFFKGIDLNVNDEFMRVRPEEKPDFQLHRGNRNAFIIINKQHYNEAYRAYLSQIEDLCVLMYESDMYEAYVW